ncbi:MAG: hypothetical protein QM634_13045, partial [Gordonia sp. (in: high G+C Gram-positive bacteria)]
MLISAVFLPAAPALVPEVSGVGAVELEPVRAAIGAAVADQAALTTSWWAVGDDDRPLEDAHLAAATSGSFGGYGVDRAVSLTPAVPADRGTLPTSMLIAGWAREVAPEVTITPIVLDAADRAACR